MSRKGSSRAQGGNTNHEEVCAFCWLYGGAEAAASDSFAPLRLQRPCPSRRGQSRTPPCRLQSGALGRGSSRSGAPAEGAEMAAAQNTETLQASSRSSRDEWRYRHCALVTQQDLANIKRQSFARSPYRHGNGRRSGVADAAHSVLCDALGILAHALKLRLVHADLQ